MSMIKSVNITRENRPAWATESVELHVTLNAGALYSKLTIADDRVPADYLVKRLVIMACEGLEKQIREALRKESVRLQTQHVKPNMEVFFNGQVV